MRPQNVYQKKTVVFWNRKSVHHATWRFYETHIFEKLSSFGRKNAIYLILLQQNSDSSPQGKRVSLNLIKLRGNFKPTGKWKGKVTAVTKCFLCLSLSYKFKRYDSILNLPFGALCQFLSWQLLKTSFNPFTPVSDTDTYIAFTLCNARRCYSSMENPLGVKG